MAPMTFIKTEKDLASKGSEVCIVTSGPDTKVDSVRNGYEKLITKAKKRIFIQTPYFVPDEGLLNHLKSQNSFRSRSKYNDTENKGPYIRTLGFTFFYWRVVALGL